MGLGCELGWGVGLGVMLGHSSAVYPALDECSRVLLTSLSLVAPQPRLGLSGTRTMHGLVAQQPGLWLSEAVATHSLVAQQPKLGLSGAGAQQPGLGLSS